MSLSSRAVERQCTRRRSSPWRYSRTPASSSPALASERARLSPLPVHSPESATDGSCMHRRRDDEGVAGAERTLQLAHAERVGEPDRQRAQAVAAADVGPHGVGHLAAAARLDPVEDEPRPRAEDVGHLVLDEQQPGRQPGDVVESQRDRRLLAGGRARRPEPAPGRQPVAGAGHHERADQRQREQQDRDAQQVLLRRRDGGDQHGDTRRRGTIVRGWSGPAARRALDGAPPAAGLVGQRAPRRRCRRRCPRSSAGRSATRRSAAAGARGRRRRGPARRRAARSRGRRERPPRARRGSGAASRAARRRAAARWTPGWRGRGRRRTAGPGRTTWIVAHDVDQLGDLGARRRRRRATSSGELRAVGGRAWSARPARSG